MDTRKNEIILNTSDAAEMYSKYTAETVFRTWQETVVNTDSSSIDTINRNEIIAEKGVLIDKELLSELTFFLQSGELKSVKVSNIARPGTVYESDTSSAYIITICGMDKKYNFYTYGNSVNMAIEIACDFIEQKLTGHYTITSVREQNNLILISDDVDFNDIDSDYTYYEVELKVYSSKYSVNNKYLLKAFDAEDAKDKIEEYMSLLNDDSEINYTLISAKKIRCKSIIDNKFSNKYINEQN